MQFQIDDGGRANAGFKGMARDCVARSVAIASGLPYSDVYAVLAAGTGAQRTTGSRGKRSATAGAGINTDRQWFKHYMRSIGFQWIPCMGIATGCTVHLRYGELPSGRLVVSLSKHYTAVVDGVVRDTHDPRRNGTRCVYGYWRHENASAT